MNAIKGALNKERYDRITRLGCSQLEINDAIIDPQKRVLANLAVLKLVSKQQDKYL